MISNFDDETQACEHSDAVMTMNPAMQQVSQLVQTAAVVMEAAVSCQPFQPADLTDTAAVETTFNDNNKDELLNETEFALLSHVTTKVGDFDPLLDIEDNKPTHFVPVLEARGGIDKDEEGHRRDTMPIANAIDEHNVAKSAVFQFLEENDGLSTHAVMTNDALRKYLKTMAHGVIVRVNPGNLSPMSTKKCDDMLRELSDAGIVILSHPDVTSSLGAKDSLVKIKNLKCGLEDTEVYYTPDSFREGFCKTIAFQPRVIKQNRGSQGEGIWICKLKDETAYCSTYGESSVSLDTELVLMEAFDNHVEYKTVGEFIDFCINGRSGSLSANNEWTTTSRGRYFEGGIAAGAMVVDQRFLPRIVEGEVRCLMIGSELVEIVHKKPKEGGLSATLQSGAVYTKYAPDHEKFAKLVKNFKDDIPHIMSSFGMSNQPLPLLWTADYIYGNTDDELYVGEINCSCVGMTQQLDLAPIVAEVAIESIFGKR